MTLLWISVLWVLASAGVAMLPMRQQYIPGVALLLAAPVLIVAIGVQTHLLLDLQALMSGWASIA